MNLNKYLRNFTKILRLESERKLIGRENMTELKVMKMYQKDFLKFWVFFKSNKKKRVNIIKFDRNQYVQRPDMQQTTNV